MDQIHNLPIYNTKFNVHRLWNEKMRSKLFTLESFKLEIFIIILNLELGKKIIQVNKDGKIQEEILGN